MPAGVCHGVIDEKEHGGDSLSAEASRKPLDTCAAGHGGREGRGHDEVGPGDEGADVVAVGEGAGDDGEEDDGPGEVAEVVEQDDPEERDRHAVVEALEGFGVHVQVPDDVEEHGREEGEEDLPLEVAEVPGPVPGKHEEEVGPDGGDQAVLLVPADPVDGVARRDECVCAEDERGRAAHEFHF